MKQEASADCRGKREASHSRPSDIHQRDCAFAHMTLPYGHTDLSETFLAQNTGEEVLGVTLGWDGSGTQIVPQKVAR